MSDIDDDTGTALRSLLAELGVVEPSSIENIENNHRELFDAYRDGKITYAALRHSLANGLRLDRHADLGDGE